MLVPGGAALALALAFGAMARLGKLHDHAQGFVLLFVLASLAYGLAAAWVVWRAPTGRPVLVLIAGAAIAFRLLLLPTAPTLSTDVCRYLWDGRLSVAGVSPYRHAPVAPELAPFRKDGLYACLNHPDWRTIYPPGAQLLFAAVVRWLSDDVLVFKGVLVGFDLLALLLVGTWLRLLGRPPAWLLLYAWHPLVVVEVAGSGHLDAVVLATTVAALLLASRGHEGWAGALVGVGTLLKLYPLLLLAAVTARRPGRSLLACAAVIGAGYGLYAAEGALVLGSLGRYLAGEHFNPGVRALLELVLAPLGPGGLYAARLLPLAVLGLIAAILVGRGHAAPVPERALWVVGAYLLATPNLFPWYALWIVPVLAAVPAWPWVYLSCAVGLTYLVFAEPVWHLPPWVVAAEFAPLVLGLGLALRRTLGKRPSPGAADGAQPARRLGESRAATSRSARPARLSP